MLAKNHRLSDRKIIAKLFRLKKVFWGELLFLKSAPSKEEDSKIAFLVGKKFEPSAARRNYLKRILRAQTQKLLPRIKTGHNIIIGVHNPKHWAELSRSAWTKAVARDLTAILKLAKLKK